MPSSKDVAIGLGLVAPGLLWSAWDSSVWNYDTAVYAQNSVDLWYALSHDVRRWLPAMLSAVRISPPAIAWAGQFFVPLGVSIGSVERGLLLMIMLAQCASLALMFQIGRSMRCTELAVFAGVLSMAAAPLFILMGHVYLIEPLQLLAVAYFYWIAVGREKMQPGALLSHFIAAASLALATKLATLAYCLIPFLVVAVDLQRRLRQQGFEGIRRWATLGSVVALGLTLTWYAFNLIPVFSHAAISFSGAYAAQWGSQRPFLAKLAYWCQTLVLFSFGRCAMILLLGAVMLWAVRRCRLTDVAAMAGWQVVGIIFLFSRSDNEMSRLLLPLLPSVTIVLMWLLSQVDRRLGAAVLFALSLQYISAYSLTLGHQVAMTSIWLNPVASQVLGVQRYHDGQVQSSEIESLIKLTSAAVPGCNQLVACGIDSPQVNASQLNFYAAKARLRGDNPAYFKGAGQGLVPQTMTWNGDAAWTALRDARASYFVTVQETALPRRWSTDMAVDLLERVRSSAQYLPVSFSSRQGILVFRHCP